MCKIKKKNCIKRILELIKINKKRKKKKVEIKPIFKYKNTRNYFKEAGGNCIVVGLEAALLGIMVTTYLDWLTSEKPKLMQPTLTTEEEINQLILNAC